MPLDLVVIPCLSDNYTYLLHDPDGGATAVIDVPDAAPVEAALANRGWTLTDILITHHHHDHVGGVEALRKATGARVTGAAADDHRLPQLDHAVVPGDVITLGSETAEILDAPGHTVGHIAYYFSASGILCTGDSLMALGCGRLFEGTAEQMWGTLSRFAALPGETRVCSGHEYTQANARFALSVEPENADLQARSRDIDAARAAGRPTVPATIAEELATNPFLRASIPSVKRALQMAGAPDSDVFAQIRRMKDAF
ncbi:MAG: hydroxyacylglutathione hydrolase [Rhodobacteraceae bacterium]|nr:hydroxyacylglutathione hydrolase [Paracoccaceae bacterium]